MELGSKALFFFSALGVFNGLIVSIYVLFFNSKKTLSNYLLGFLLMALSIRIGKSVAFYFDYSLPKIYLQIGLTACFFIGPFLYNYVKSEVNKVEKLPKNWLLMFTLWMVIALGFGLTFPYQTNPELWGKIVVPIIYLQWGIHIALVFIAFIPLFKKLLNKEKLMPIESWVIFVAVAITILFMFYVWAYLSITKGSYINGALYFSVFMYLVGFVLLYRKKESDSSTSTLPKYADKKMDDDEADRLYSMLQKAMEDKVLYKNPNLKVSDLANEINITSHQLSQLLNDNKATNFTLFVNEYRIEEACRMLSKNSIYTIDAIGYEVGFNSKSTFFATFKKIKGLTPSAFQKSGIPNL
jgi:AraC-like DNA-binding protein